MAERIEIVVVYGAGLVQGVAMVRLPAASSILIAAYQIGHGLAAFTVGPLPDDLGIDLATIYRVTAIVAVAIGLLSFVVVSGRRRALV